MKAIIITGSREWTDQEPIRAVLLNALLSCECLIVVHGACEGADMSAEFFCREMGIRSLLMPAKWKRDGKQAGPLRNSEMINVAHSLAFCGYDVEVHAFPMPNSKGTWDLVRKSEDAGFKVTVHKP